MRKTREKTGAFDTHPPIRQRIALLLEMAHVGPEALATAPEGPPPGPVAPA